MAANLDACLLRVCDVQGETKGTGFVVTGRLAVTYAHVVEACGGAPGGRVQVVFHVNGQGCAAEVLADYWQRREEDDLAVLSLMPEGERLPDNVIPAVLGSTLACEGHAMRTQGFAALPSGYDFARADGYLRGVVPHASKRLMVQLDAHPVRPGMSGAPVLDLVTQRVVGIVSEFLLNAPLEWATTSETLAAICPDIRLCPPEAVDVYLRAYSSGASAAFVRATLPAYWDRLL